jgi:type IV pilus assembly protein PilQ
MAAAPAGRVAETAVIRAPEESAVVAVTSVDDSRSALDPVPVSSPAPATTATATLAEEPVSTTSWTETDDRPAEIAEPAATTTWQAEVASEPLPRIASMQAAGTPENPVVAPAPSGAPGTTLRGVENFGDGTIWIAGDGEFAYSTFRLENPERFVIDLDGVVNRSDRGTLPIDESELIRVRVSQFRSRPTPVARVVFDLNALAIPAIDRDDRGITVRFGTAAAAVGSTAAQAVEEVVSEAPVAPTSWATEEVAEPIAAPAPADPSPSYAPVAAEEQAVVSPPARYEAAVEPTPAIASPSDVTEFAASSQPTSSPRVADFEAQDVQPLSRPTPGVPRLTPAVVAGQTVISTDRKYTGEPISMSLKDTDVREVLRTFARLSGLNVVIQPGVRGSVTVELERVPWDQALDQILKINGLGYELDGNIMRVAPLQVLQREARRARQLRAAQALSVPLRTVVKRLSYSQAGQIAGLLQRGAGGVMSRRGSVIVDGRTNTLILKELPNFIDTVLAVIETLDTPEPQVVIEARIVETTKQFSRSLGINWGFAGVSSQAKGNATGLEFPYHGTANGGVSLLTGGSNAFINLALGNVLDTFTLNARLQVAESEGLINVLSAPKIVTLNNSAASIQSGVQLPIQTSANNTTSVRFVNATLKLTVTPHVTAEGTVLMDIKVQKREPLFAFQVAGAPSAPISTKDAKTRVIVRDGGTTVIGGIYKVSTDQGQDRVPGLSNVPLLGNLFKNRRSRNDNDELLIFVTPRVVKL